VNEITTGMSDGRKSSRVSPSRYWGAALAFSVIVFCSLHYDTIAVLRSEIIGQE